eukprot:TRINITY_DN64240_c0_g2_i2.p1 TRINITY_DN64240_c0_g2~~TRINITY_DN64240_c0_g2_i2.p1  ORF type:complete len:366 (+),score=23.31 TRINITY_DN64240_c0_g2_i2:53-1150(+)
MSVFSPWGKPKKTAQTAVPRTPTQGARPQRQQQSPTPQTPRGAAPRVEKYGGPAEMLGVCHHNFPAPPMNEDHPQFKQLHCLPRYNGKVFRTCRVTPADLDHYVPGQQFRWRTFVSTTSERNNLHGYKDSSNTIFIIHLTEATHAADVSQQPGSVADEAEVLIAPYQLFIVRNYETKNAVHYITIATHERPVIKAAKGFHLLCRADNFESHSATLQDELISLAESCTDIQSPVYFEKQNEYAVAYIKHADDDLEWKVVVIGACAPSFLADLVKSRPVNRTLSILYYAQGCSVPQTILRDYPTIVEVTNDPARILKFVQHPTSDMLANKEASVMGRIHMSPQTHSPISNGYSPESANGITSEGSQA